MNQYQQIKKKGFRNALYITGVMGATTALVATGIVNAIALVFAALACVPMAKVVWQVATFVRTNALNILRRALPKTGCIIDHIEWNDDHTATRYYCTFQGNEFMLEAYYDSASVSIVEKPWGEIDASSPHIIRILEAINQVNGKTPSISVVMNQPDEHGNRQLFTRCLTILPSVKPEHYLIHTMQLMINSESQLNAAVYLVGPDTRPRRNPMGFAPAQPEPSDEPAGGEPVAPAAQNATHAE